MNTFFRLIFALWAAAVVILLYACGSEQNDCPFPTLTFKTTHTRTGASITLSNKIGVVLERFSKKIPINIAVMNDVAGKLSHEIESTEKEPIDSLLAANYNAQRAIICIAYQMWKEEKGMQKEIYAEDLNKRIAQLFMFMDDYRNDRPVKTVEHYEVTFVPESPVVNILPGSEKIINYIKEKIKNSPTALEKAYWEEILAANNAYISSCAKEATPKTCLEDLWNELQTLSFH